MCLVGILFTMLFNFSHAHVSCTDNVNKLLDISAEADAAEMLCMHTHNPQTSHFG